MLSVRVGLQLLDQFTGNNKERKAMANIPAEQLLAEIDDLLRTKPERATIRHDLDVNHAWVGRASALVTQISVPLSFAFNRHVEAFWHQPSALEAGRALHSIMTILHQARQTLRLQVGPVAVAIEHGAVFDYFDEIRKVVESATADLFFVDPYLDAEFVGRYLPQVQVDVAVRLLGKEKMASLIPAVSMFRQQSGLNVEARKAASGHDRFIFVDGAACYQSGSSFKDGAKTAPTTFTQMLDPAVISAMNAVFEGMWQAAATP
jgi:hypothetical protein